MEVVMDMKGLDKPCDCGRDKLAGACCKKGEDCPCGSGKKAGSCCFKDASASDAKNSKSN